MTERRPFNETFGQFRAALNRFGADYVVIANKKASGRPKDLADVDLLTSDDPIDHPSADD